MTAQTRPPLTRPSPARFERGDHRTQEKSQESGEGDGNQHRLGQVERGDDGEERSADEVGAESPQEG
jgi:hypothetical protein